jgi:hypothetical protein
MRVSRIAITALLATVFLVAQNYYFFRKSSTQRGGPAVSIDVSSKDQTEPLVGGGGTEDVEFTALMKHALAHLNSNQTKKETLRFFKHSRDYFSSKFRADRLPETRKSIYAHELMDHGESFLHFNFASSPFTPRCTEASITTFKGPAMLGRCASIMTNDFVWATNDFPQCIPNPPLCHDLYEKYFKKPLDSGENLNQPLNLLDLFLPHGNVTIVSAPKIVPIMFLWGYVFPHTIKDTMPRVVLSLPYLAANPDAKLLIEKSEFSINFMRRIGIPNSRILWTRETSFHQHGHYNNGSVTVYLATQEMALPHCHPGPFGTGIYSSEMYHALRDLLVKEPHLPESERNLILYVARDGGTNFDAKKGFMRRLDNEKVVIEMLNSTLQDLKESGRFEQLGLPEPEFMRFKGKGMTLDAQIALFRRARVVFGPHGGGFYNLIFAAPGTHVVELSPDDYGKYEVARLSTNLGLDYNGYIKKGMLRTETFGDIDVNWFVTEVLHKYSPDLVGEPAILPDTYKKINREEMAAYSSLKISS